MLALLAAAAAAGPWVHAPGSSYTKLAFSAFDARATADGARFRGRSVSLYTEAGLVRPLEIVAELPYVWASNRYGDSALAYRSSGPGTARLGLGLSPPAVDFPAALHALVRWPLAAAHGTPLDPPLGDTQIDVELLASVGASPPLGPSRIWLLAEGGSRHRSAIRPVDGVGRPGIDGLYRLQMGLLPGRLGWWSLEAAGQADLAGGLSSHRLGTGAAVTLPKGWHPEISIARIYAARGSAPGWGLSAGLSLVLPAT